MVTSRELGTFMDGCPICQHAKVQAMSTALAHGRHVAVVATQFRVNKVDLAKHLQHAKTQAVATDAIEIPDLEARMPPLRRFKQAWQDAKDDRQEQQRMVNWLNEQLSEDEMGL